MHISLRTLVGPTALAFVFGAGLALAQDQPRTPPAPAQAQAQVASAEGELLEVDAKASTLSIKTPTAEMKFRYDDLTKVSGAQKGVVGLATMKGAQVTVQYKKDGQTNIATSIEVHADRAPRN